MTHRASSAAKCNVAFRIGGELGPVWEGCANGPAVVPCTFDIAKLGGGRAYRRFRGAQALDVNNGRLVGQRVTVPPQEGLLLMAE